MQGGIKFKWRKWNKMRETEQNGVNIIWQEGGKEPR